MPKSRQPQKSGRRSHTCRSAGLMQSRIPQFIAATIRVPNVRSASPSRSLHLCRLVVTNPNLFSAVRCRSGTRGRSSDWSERPACHTGGRGFQWVSGRLGEAPAYAGTDLIIVRDESLHHTREHREGVRDWLDCWTLMTFGSLDTSPNLIGCQKLDTDHSTSHTNTPVVT